MRGGREERITGDCINATFQGYFCREQVEEDQSLSGTGIIIDDQFNFFLSHWKDNRLNGPTFIRTIHNSIVYGMFQQNLPEGVISMQVGDFQIFIRRDKLKGRYLEWAREGVIFHHQSNMFYVIELNRREEHDNTVDLDSTQKMASSDSYRADRIKIQWKVKIVERCNLKADGSLAVFSKYLKILQSRKKAEIDKKSYSTRQQNLIELISIIMGANFVDASMVSLFTFLKKQAFRDSQIYMKYLQEHSDHDVPLVFLGVKQHNLSIYKQNQKNLGILIDTSKGETKSIGSYSRQCNLQGLGIQFNKFGQSFIGIFKQNLLIKQYKYNCSGISKNVSSLPINELLSQQHLKSMNYVHSCHYVPELTEVLGLANKIIKYVKTFEKQYEKRHLNYNDTLPYNSSRSSEAMNVHKYVSISQRQEENVSSLNRLVRIETQAEFKKPGFIMNKSQNKSKQRQTSLTPSNNSPNRKTPERQIRMKGKIYDRSGEGGSIKYSPTRLIGVKINQQSTLKKGYHY